MHAEGPVPINVVPWLRQDLLHAFRVVHTSGHRESHILHPQMKVWLIIYIRVYYNIVIIICGAGGVAGWVPVHSSGSAKAGLDHQLLVPLCHLWVHDWCISHHCPVPGTPSFQAPLHCQESRLLCDLIIIKIILVIIIIITTLSSSWWARYVRALWLIYAFTLVKWFIYHADAIHEYQGNKAHLSHWHESLSQLFTLSEQL